jgi:hypothetical protein
VDKGFIAAGLFMGGPLGALAAAIVVVAVEQVREQGQKSRGGQHDEVERN